MARQFIGHVKGEDGYTPRKGVDYFDGEKGDPGEKGEPGQDGADGYTPQKGTDYWTPEDVQKIQEYIDKQIGGALSETY